MITSSSTPIPVIDTNMRRGIVPNRLSVNRRIGVDLRREYSALYSLCWEIEWAFSILKEIMKAENRWYAKNRNYDTAIGLKIIAFNLIVVSNIEKGKKSREIMKIVSC